MRAVPKCLFIAILYSLLPLTAQTTPSAANPTDGEAAKPKIQVVGVTYTNPASGRQMFDTYCASCHGQGGIGNGPAAPALKVLPSNLTQLSAQHGGKFPETHVVLAVVGDTMAPAHGNKDMPVWGSIFHSTGEADVITQLRIRNLTAYVQRLQQK